MSLPRLPRLHPLCHHWVLAKVLIALYMYMYGTIYLFFSALATIAGSLVYDDYAPLLRSDDDRKILRKFCSSEGVGMGIRKLKLQETVEIVRFILFYFIFLQNYIEVYFIFIFIYF